jgi:D-glucosaminate-6-phosphate ammonia-lyase
MLTHYLSRTLEGLRRGATRRQLLQGGGALAAGWLLPFRAVAGTGAAQPAAARKSTYETMGVRPLINARGTVTIVGATRLLPEVKQAMEEATRQYVQLDELMDSVGRRLRELTGAEFGIVTAGCSAALTIATAGCIAGGDPDKQAQLPDLTGLKDEVITTSYSRTAYDQSVRAAGVRMIEVATREEFEAALGPRTAMIMVLAGGGSEDGPLSLKEIASLAKPRGIPILVDAAAEGLAVPNTHLTQGADMVAYSGGKRLRGPQCAGLLIGRKDLVQAAWISGAPHHGFARGFKVGREEIMGMLAAVEVWMKRDHAEDARVWTTWLERIERRLKPIPGVITDLRRAEGASYQTPSLRVQWDMKRIPLNGFELENVLWDGEPRVAVDGAGSFLPFPPDLEPDIRINPSQLEAGEEVLIADRLYAVLSNPPRMRRRSDAPAVDVSGQWDVELKFVSGSASHSLALEAKGNNVLGTHYGSFGPRDLSGTLLGRDILFRSSYTQQGVRLNFTFTGIVSSSTMEGKVSLGEYGTADWKAKRRTYQGVGTPSY